MRRVGDDVGDGFVLVPGTPDPAEPVRRNGSGASILETPSDQGLRPAAEDSVGNYDEGDVSFEGEQTLEQRTTKEFACAIDLDKEQNQVLFAGVASALAGSLVPVQTSVNAMLAASLGSSLAAAGVSMAGSGLIVLPMVVMRWSRPRTTAYQELRPWMLLGGAFGAAYVASLILLSQPLGFAALFVVAEAGSMIVAMRLDSIGFAGSAVRRVTRLRVLGVCLPVLACVLLEGPAAVADRESGAGLRARLPRLAWALAAGGCKPLQAGMCNFASSLGGPIGTTDCFLAQSFSPV